MKNKRILTILLAVILLVPAIFGVSKAQASYPSFTISNVKTDETVTILTKDMPKNLDFKVLMGEYNTRGVGGIEAAQFNSGESGSFQVTINIPDALKGRAMISIRIESLTGGYYYYNWFWNKQDGGTWPPGATPTTPPTTQTPAPTQPPVKVYPSFSIKAVVKGETVTISAKNFPKEVVFVAKMGKMWTQGINGIVSGEITSSDNAFEATFDIPAELVNEQRIAIRLEAKTGGWYAYNWFWNNTSATQPTEEPTPAPTQPPVVKYPYFNIKAVLKNETVTIEGYNYPADTEFVVRMGKMWTQGINGIEVATFNSGTGGSLEATFDIPAELAGLGRISIRMDAKTGGWHAYNWFWNNTANQ